MYWLVCGSMWLDYGSVWCKNLEKLINSINHGCWVLCDHSLSVFSFSRHAYIFFWRMMSLVIPYLLNYKELNWWLCYKKVTFLFNCCVFLCTVEDWVRGLIPKFRSYKHESVLSSFITNNINLAQVFILSCSSGRNFLFQNMNKCYNVKWLCQIKNYHF